MNYGSKNAIFTKTVATKFFGLGGSTNTISVSFEWNASLVGEDVLIVLDGGFKSTTSDGSSGFESVLEMDSDVTSAGLDGYVGEGVSYENKMVIYL